MICFSHMNHEVSMTAAPVLTPVAKLYKTCGMTP